MSALPSVGDRIEKRLLLSADEVRAGAVSVGDENPVHHEAEAAAAAGFPSIIASGSHVFGGFSAMIPSHLIRYGAMLGAEMDVRFSAPIFPDTPYDMIWTIAELAARKNGNSYDVRLTGEIRSVANERPLVTANARGVLFPTTAS